MSEVATAAPSAPSTPAPSSTPAPVASSSAPSKAPASAKAEGTAPSKPSLGDQVGKKPEPAALEKPVEAMTQAEKRKFKLKVDGEEFEEELSDDDIRIRLQKDKAADKRLQEAAGERKKLAAALDFLRKNPKEALKQFGHDFDKLAQEHIAQLYNRETMDPAERERQDLQEKLKTYEQKEAERTKTEETQKQQAHREKVWSEMQEGFVQALDKVGYDKGFAKSTLLPIMADVQEAALEAGVDLSPDEVAHETTKRLEVIHKKQMASLKGEALMKYLGDDAVNDIIHTKIRMAGLSPNAPAPAPAAPKEIAPEPRVKSEKQYRNALLGVVAR